MLARIALLLCVAGALGRRHRQAVVELASQDEDRPSDAIGDAALRDRLDAVHRARLSRLLRLRRQQQQVAPSRVGPVAHGGPYDALEAPQGSGGGRRDYDDDDDDSSNDDGETLYADDEEADVTGGMHGGVGGGVGKRRGGDRRAGGGGRIKSVHRDPYTDVADDENDEYGNEHNDNRGGRRGALSTSESEGVSGNARPGNSRDNGSLRRRMDCIVDRVNNCIEWCRLKPTDTRLRQNRDNEPCRYWRGDMKNKWMQSGICHNGRCG
uniref:Uncharacterized protein n=1 Tax=Rhipicephalus appendiculatus TaxID=34631 RepID=A0A131YP05_RHIAP